MIDGYDVREDEGHALRSIVSLLESLDAFSHQIGVLPTSMLHLRQHPQHRLRFPHHFDDSGRRERLGRAPEIDEVAELLARTVEYEVEQEHEAAWNCAVHWPLANMALKLSVHEGVLNLKNITVARIQPPELAPNRASGSKLASKMVDLAFVLRPNDSTKAGFKNLDIEGTAPLESYNQSCLNTIIDKPIAISIETKAGTVAEDEGLTQLTIWAHAQFTKLKRLMKSARGQQSHPNAALSPLLLAIARGAKWTFLFATQDPQGLMTLWRYNNEFNANTKLGFYQVVAALQLVIDWAETFYRPWFEAYAVPLTLEQREHFGCEGGS